MNLNQRFQDAMLQWRQNQRLRYAVLLAVVTLGMHGVLKLADKRDAVAKEWGSDQELIARLKAVTSEPEWVERGATMQQRLRANVLALPQIVTMGQAKAEQSVWLLDIAKRAKLPNPRVLVEDALEVPKYPGLVQVVARLESDAVIPWTIGPMLRTLGQGLPWRQVERAEFGSSNPTRFSVIVRSYYRTPEIELPPAPPRASVKIAGSAKESKKNRPAAPAAGAVKPASGVGSKEPKRSNAVRLGEPKPVEGGVLEHVLSEPPAQKPNSHDREGRR